MLKRTHLIITALLAVTLLTACGGSGDGDATENEVNTSGQASVGSLFGGEEEENDCAPIDDPVCADLDDEKMTFANACEADAAGSESWTHGECE